MPELPEVETIRKQLASFIVGKTVASVDVSDPMLQNYLTAAKVEEVKGLKVARAERRAKVLLIALEKNMYFAIHLKMTGKVIYRDQHTDSKALKISDTDLQTLPNKFTRTIVHFTDGSRLYFLDERRFGWVKILTQEQLATDLLKGSIGPEPLTDSFTKEYLCAMLAKNKQQIKVVLMDQAKIGGIGNIYANESLYLAKIHPQRRANSLTRQESDKLFEAIVEVLQKGLKYRGASEDNYRDALGQKGEYHHHFVIYQQHGKPCTYCGSKVVRITVGGRGTFLCPACQLI